MIPPCWPGWCAWHQRTFTACCNSADLPVRTLGCRLVRSMSEFDNCCSRLCHLIRSEKGSYAAQHISIRTRLERRLGTPIFQWCESLWGSPPKINTKTRTLSTISVTDSNFFESSMPHPLRVLRLVALPFIHMIKGLEHEPGRPLSELG